MKLVPGSWRTVICATVASLTAVAITGCGGSSSGQRHRSVVTGAAARKQVKAADPALSAAEKCVGAWNTSAGAVNRNEVGEISDNLSGKAPAKVGVSAGQPNVCIVQVDSDNVAVLQWSQTNGSFEQDSGDGAITMGKAYGGGSWNATALGSGKLQLGSPNESLATYFKEKFAENVCQPFYVAADKLTIRVAGFHQSSCAQGDSVIKDVAEQDSAAFATADQSVAAAAKTSGGSMPDVTDGSWKCSGGAFAIYCVTAIGVGGPEIDADVTEPANWTSAPTNTASEKIAESLNAYLSSTEGAKSSSTADGCDANTVTIHISVEFPGSQDGCSKFLSALSTASNHTQWVLTKNYTEQGYNSDCQYMMASALGGGLEPTSPIDIEVAGKGNTSAVALCNALADSGAWEPQAD